MSVRQRKLIKRLTYSVHFSQRLVQRSTYTDRQLRAAYRSTAHTGDTYGAPLLLRMRLRPQIMDLFHVLRLVETAPSFYVSLPAVTNRVQRERLRESAHLWTCKGCTNTITTQDARQGCMTTLATQIARKGSSMLSIIQHTGRF